MNQRTIYKYIEIDPENFQTCLLAAQTFLFYFFIIGTPPCSDQINMQFPVDDLILAGSSNQIQCEREQGLDRRSTQRPATGIDHQTNRQGRGYILVPVNQG